MPTKIFTTLGGKCPFGMGCDIDTQPCRNCKHFYRAGTGMFFWCNHPVEDVPEKTDSVLKSTKSVPKARKSVPKASKDAPKQKKRGRPAKKAILMPVNAKKEKNG